MKYMGSKARFTKELLPIILKDREDGQWYVEPFAGGMNMISEVSGNRIANDNHRYLIEMWSALLNGWTPPSHISKEQYYEIKATMDTAPPELVGWVGFNCSYSGKWFDGYAGKTKTKSGSIRDYQLEAAKNIANQLPKMQNIILSNLSFDDLQIPANSIVYCDPPYFSTRKYATKIDHNYFWDWVRNLSNNGHQVFVSEYTAPDDFECIWQKETKSSISANGVTGGSHTSIEKLFIKGGSR